MSAPFRVLLADDEPPALARLRQLFASEAHFEVALECPDGEAAERALLAGGIDLALLDVQMPGKSGLDVVRAVGPRRMPTTVFVTAHDEHALAAFELHALDYLLKPFDRERFQAMLARARRELARASSAHARRLEALLAERESPLALRSGGRTVLIDPATVEWLEAADNYVRVEGGGPQRIVRATLAALEALLAPHGFVRIHRSLLVNAAAVREIRPGGSGELVLLLASGARLVAGRSYRAALERRWPAREPGRD